MKAPQWKKPPIWLAKLSAFSRELQTVRWLTSPAVGTLEGYRPFDLDQTISQATLQTQHRVTSPDELATLRDSLDRRWESNCVEFSPGSSGRGGFMAYKPEPENLSILDFLWCVHLRPSSVVSLTARVSL